MVTRTMRSRNRRPRSAEQIALVDRVTSDAVLFYGNRADEGELQRHAEHAVDEICNSPVKVTAFVPILALRRVGELLDESNQDLQPSARH